MKARKAISLAGILVLFALGVYLGVRHTSGEWKGVDENVVEKFAKEAGRPPREPYINTEQGDLLLLVFLLGGAAGGFLFGYNFRALFGAPPLPKAIREKHLREGKIACGPPEARNTLPKV
jgi:ABC-type cobalt transport system substrate-binding protein